MPPRAPLTPEQRRRQRMLLTLWIISPLAVLTVLCVWMYRSLQTAPYMNAPAKGAGAGHTGMSNEYMGLGKDRPRAPGATGATGSPAVPGAAGGTGR